MLILIVVSGPDKGKVFELAGRETVVLGREGDPVRLHDSKASRRHATLRFREGHWHIRDQASRHGTFHNHERVTGEVQLQDGDHIQIGETLLVMAQANDAAHPHPTAAAAPLPAHADAERGSASEASDITIIPGLPRRWQTPALLAASLGGALLLVGGGTLYLNSKLDAAHLDTQRHAQRLEQQLADRDARDAERDAQFAKLLSERNNDTVEANLLRAVTLLEAQSPRLDAIDELRLAIESQGDQVAPQLQAILARIDEQPDYTGELASLQKTLQAQMDMQQPLLTATQRLAEGNQGLLPRMAALIEQAENQPSLDDVNETLAALNTRLDGQPGADEIIEGVTAALAKRSDPAMAELREMLVQIDERTKQQGVVQERLASLESAVREAGQREAESDELTSTMLRSLTEQMAAQGRDDAVLAAIDEMKADLPLDAIVRMEAAVARLGDTPTPEQVATAVTHELAQDRETQTAAMARLAELIEGEPWAQRIQEQGDQTREALAAVTQALQDRPTLEQVKAELASLSQADREAIRGQFDAVLARIETGGDVAGELAEVRKLLKQQPAMAEAALSRVMEAVELLQADDRSEQVLAAVQDLRQAVSGRELVAVNEVKLQVREGLIDALAQSTLIPPDVIAAMQTAHDEEEAGSQLSEVEMLYRYAWLSNQPVTIGLGKVNPLTGESTPGEVIDPRLPKQAGINSWRQWYVNDRLIRTRELLGDKRLAREVEPESEQTAEEVNLEPPTPQVLDPFNSGNGVYAIPDGYEIGQSRE